MSSYVMFIWCSEKLAHLSYLWNLRVNKVIITIIIIHSTETTVFTHVLVDPVYKSTPNFWGQKLDFF